MPRRDDAMSDEELKYPTWQGPLQDAIVEFDPKSCPNKYREPRL
jgi:hypothetical protein